MYLRWLNIIKFHTNSIEIKGWQVISFIKNFWAATLTSHSKNPNQQVSKELSDSTRNKLTSFFNNNDAMLTKFIFALFLGLRFLSVTKLVWERKREKTSQQNNIRGKRQKCSCVAINQRYCNTFLPPLFLFGRKKMA